MIHRTHDAGIVGTAVSHSKQNLEFNAIDWLDNDNNIALASGQDVALFDYGYPGLYTGHYFFTLETRGKKALELAREMITEMFVNRGAKVIRGLTPLDNQAARWMTRRLGFESHGAIETTQGYLELFTLLPDSFFHTLNSTAKRD